MSTEASERNRFHPEGKQSYKTDVVLTRNEVEKHNSEDDCWVIIDQSVYDLTAFLDVHPGGAKIITQVAGKDVTDDFYALHRYSILTKYGPKFFIGRLADAPPPNSPGAAIGGPEHDDCQPGHVSKVPFAEAVSMREGWHCPYYNDSHRTFRINLRKFLQEEIFPIATEGEMNERIPDKDTLRLMGEKGCWAARIGAGPHMKGRKLFGINGEDFDVFHEQITHEEFARLGYVAFMDGLGTGLVIGLPPVAHFAIPEVRDRVVNECISGEKVVCLAVSEPWAGSDVANIKATAVKTEDGRHYVVNGIKKWITNGLFADYFVTAVRTGDAGVGGVSLLLVERTEGVITERIPVSYGAGAGTSLVIMEDVLVPVENLLGEENRGFQVIMSNFNHERWFICAMISGAMRAVVEECYKWSMQRSVFGKKLIGQPVIRQKLAKISAKVEGINAWTESVTYQLKNMNAMEQFMLLAGPIALLKMEMSRVALEVMDDCVQIFGGRALTKTGMGMFIERFMRAIKFSAILGGSEEIMADLAIRLASRNFPATARL